MAPRITDRPDMAAYGVPEDLGDVLAWTWAEERLVGSRCYWVATANASGRPHAMPVWGAWLTEPEGFFFSCAPSARKARNLAVNPAVTVASEDPREFVSVEGVAAPITAGSALEAGIDAFFAKYGDEMGIPREDVASFLTDSASYLVAPERAFGMIETPEDFGPKATRWRW
jgi:hypothetical protein